MLLATRAFTAAAAAFLLAGPARGEAQFRGDATYYYTGLGNCGAQSKDSDFIVALSTQEYSGGAHCWQHIGVAYQGKVIDATVVDSCPGCSQYSIDLSPAAFDALASRDAGRIQVDWWYK